MKISQLVQVSTVAVLTATAAAAQDRPFLFSISTPPTDTRRTTVHFDAGVGERPFDLVEGDRAEQRMGVQTSFRNGVTLLGRVGFSTDARDVRTSQQAEVLYSVHRSRDTQSSVAVGGGMRHESAGVDVLIGRVAAGRSFNNWRLDSNALFEKPFSTGRDAVDLITSVGVARRLSSAFYAGIELIGEDLEGFWEAEETEGGARILIGPSLRIAPATMHWQLSVAGGRVFHATQSSASATPALRALPGSPNSGYAARASLSYVF